MVAVAAVAWNPGTCVWGRHRDFLAANETGLYFTYVHYEVVRGFNSRGCCTSAATANANANGGLLVTSETQRSQLFQGCLTKFRIHPWPEAYSASTGEG